MKENSKSSLNSVWVVFKKEVIDNFRDKRTLTTMLVSVIAMPLLLIGILWFTEKSINEEIDPVTAEALQLPVVGAEHAPNLMLWLKQSNIDILDAPDDPEQSIRVGEHRLILAVNQEFSEHLGNGKTAPVKLIHDSSITGLEQIGKGIVERAIDSYSQQLAQLRLQARGIDPQITQPIHINLSDVASAESKNAEMLNILPYMIVIFIMMGGMYLAIDTTAGEREKGSLEPLLTLPISRRDTLLAKLFATCLFSAITFALVLIGLALAMAYAPVDSINFRLDVSKLVFIFVTCLPFVFAASALLILVASFTKSYKEAQSYLPYIMLLPSMPLILLTFLSPEATASNMLISSLSQALIILETFKGEVIPASLILISMASTLALGILFTVIAVKFYQRERVLG